MCGVQTKVVLKEHRPCYRQDCAKKGSAPIQTTHHTLCAHSKLCTRTSYCIQALNRVYQNNEAGSYTDNQQGVKYQTG
jgi:hypothetical protein